MDESHSEKKAIRERILAARGSMDEAERAAKSSAICKRIESIKEYTDANGILYYMPIRGEADITALLQEELQRGRLCALPKCASGRSLKLHCVTNLDADIEPGAWGIPEPKDCTCEYTCGQFSVIIVPGVAFDRQGSRIGYGAGYYDRLLAGVGLGALKIAPAFTMQVLPELPHGRYDVPVDIIVTEDGIIDCRKVKRSIPWLKG